MPKPTFRKLRGYAFDPSFAATIASRRYNEVVYKINWEDTSPGPIGEYIEVIDYDPTTECYYETVNLDDNYVMADHGLAPSDSDPRFHQQQVYAVSMTIIEQFEKALGRKIIWSRVTDNGELDRREISDEFVKQLRIYPHAMRQQNAYYSPAKLSLLFGYFESQQHWKGNNIPGTAIFTCLSPDIVAHEITHAILDSLHPYLRKATNHDMPAFHEGFADIIALLQRFSFRSVVEEQIRNSRGDLLSPQNLLGDLAIQFGQSVSQHRRALRSYLVEKQKNGEFKVVEPDPTKYHTELEPHKRGALLVAAVFDAFTRLYKYRVADLIRLASDGTGILKQGEIDPDLVKRLSEEACDIANKLMMITIRALDYCPPVDLTFGDYLRALITADVEHNPADEGGLRYALLESFRSWGIVPKGINTYSVESLQWKRMEEFFEDPEMAPLVDAFKSSISFLFGPSTRNRTGRNISQSMESILRAEDREMIFNESRDLSMAVHEMFGEKFEVRMSGMEKVLGMSFEPVRFEYYDEFFEQNVVLEAKARAKFQVHKCRPIMQYNAMTGRTKKWLLITFIQKIYVNLTNTPYEGYLDDDSYDFRAGATLIIDLSDFTVKYSIAKKITSADRIKKQLHYLINHPQNEQAALLMQDDEPFAALHIH